MDVKAPFVVGPFLWIGESFGLGTPGRYYSEWRVLFDEGAWQKHKDFPRVALKGKLWAQNECTINQAWLKKIER